MKPRQSVLSRVASILTLGWSDSKRGRLVLRRSFSNFVRGVMRLRSGHFQPSALTSALVFAPHPDDETFGCGGTLAIMSGSNVSVNLAFITDGRASHPFHAVVTPAEIATRRRAEAMAASSVLGIDPDRVAFLGAPDGALAQLQEEDIKKILEGIAGLLSRVMPEAILLPCRSDGSSEHDAAFRLVHRALDSTGLRPRIFEYPVWSWWNPVLLLRSMFGYKRIWRVELGSAQAVKARAMALYLSQTIPIPPDITPALPIGFASMFLSKAEFLLEK